jgi:hypothetical protein
MGSGAKSYRGKVFLIYEEIRKYSFILRRLLVIYEFAPDPFSISLSMRKILFYFLAVL